MRILIFRIGQLGDTVIALPALQAIRDQFPKAQITLLSNVYSRASHVRPSQILPSELINEWIFYESDHGRRSLLDSLSLLWSLRRKHYDSLVYLAPRSRKPKDVRRDLLFFRLAGIRSVIGQDGFDPLPALTSAGLPVVDHETDHLLHRLALSGISVPDKHHASIDLQLTDGERAFAEQWLAENVPSYLLHDVVGFGGGSKWPSKVWPEERIVDVGRNLIRERNIFPVVFGGPEDQMLAARLIDAWERGASAAGILSPRLAAAALSNCLFFVGNDTGTMHLAAAVGTPCVVTMSAQDWPGRWNPYSEGHVVLRRNVPCAGCMLDVCEIEEMRCLKEITVDDVVKACCEILDREHPGHIPARAVALSVPATGFD